MKRNPNPDTSDWNVSLWFAVSSPLLGVLLGTFAAMNAEVMSITAIVSLLIVLLFGFDSAGQEPPAT